MDDGISARTEAKAVVNVQTSYGETPLHWERKSKIVKLLLRYGAEIEVKDNLGDTPVLKITRFTNTHFLRALIDAGFDFNTRGRFGHTVLHSAVLHRNAVALEYLLLRAGGKSIINAQDSRGLTPLGLAIDNFRWRGSQPTEKPVIQALVNLLVQYGSDLEVKNFRGRFTHTVQQIGGKLRWMTLSHVVEVDLGEYGGHE